MSLTVSVYAALLFFVLTPGILLKLPTNKMFSILPIKGNKSVITAIVHALVFGLVFYLTKPIVWRFGVRLEGMSDLEEKKETKEKEEKKESMSFMKKEEKEEKEDKEEEKEEEKEGFLGKLFKK